MLFRAQMSRSMDAPVKSAAMSAAARMTNTAILNQKGIFMSVSASIVGLCFSFAKPVK